MGLLILGSPAWIEMKDKKMKYELAAFEERLKRIEKRIGISKNDHQVDAGVSRWRDVKDELPSFDVEVLLWDNYWNNFTFGHRSKVPKPQVFGQRTDTERHKIGWSWGSRTGSLPYKNITHWIPLPEQPSG